MVTKIVVVAVVVVIILSAVILITVLKKNPRNSYDYGAVNVTGNMHIYDQLEQMKNLLTEIRDQKK